MHRPISIKDLARLAGVSHSTVSRALRGSPLVGPDLRKRIERLAESHGYQASVAAQSLVTRQSKSIGCVVTRIADPFMGEVVSGIQDAAGQNGYAVFLADSNATPKREMETVRMLAQRRVDGVVVAASRVGAAYQTALSSLRIPVVLINNQSPGEHIYSVAVDNGHAAGRMMRHLLELGHRRIAYIGDRKGVNSDCERHAAYSRSLRLAGVRCERDLTVYGESDPASGERAMVRLLALKRPPTAVFCYNDVTALGALKAIHAAGLNVPRDISVAGFDDLFFAAFSRPPLTSLHQPVREMGRTAVEVLLNVLRGDRAGRHIKVDAELVIRESTGPLPSATSRVQKRRA